MPTVQLRTAVRYRGMAFDAVNVLMQGCNEACMRKHWAVLGLLCAMGCDGCDETEDPVGGGGGGGGEGPINQVGGGGEGGGTSCALGTADCDMDPSNGCEVDTETDPLHCGACADPCGVGTCVAGMCQSAETLASGLPTLAGIATDGTSLFFASGGHAAQVYLDGRLYSLPVAGGEDPTSVAGPYPSVEAVAIAGNQVVFSSLGTQGGDALDGFIARVPTTGGTVETFAPMQPYATQIFADGTTYYWANTGTFSASFADGSIRSSADGAAAVTLVEPEVSPTHVLVDGGFVYWNATGTPALPDNDAAIRRRLLSGGATETLMSGLDRVSALAVVDGQLYFGTTGGISVMDVGMPEQATHFADATNNIPSMLVADGFLYWTEPSEMGRVVRKPLDGGPEVVLAEGLNVPYGLVVDETHVYFTVRGTGVDDGSVMRIQK